MYHRMIIPLIAFAIALSAVLGAAASIHQTQLDPPPNRLQLFVASSGAFALQYPSDWQVTVKREDSRPNAVFHGPAGCQLRILADDKQWSSFDDLLADNKRVESELHKTLGGRAKTGVKNIAGRQALVREFMAGDKKMYNVSFEANGWIHNIQFDGVPDVWDQYLDVALTSIETYEPLTLSSSSETPDRELLVRSLRLADLYGQAGEFALAEKVLASAKELGIAAESVEDSQILLRSRVKAYAAALCTNAGKLIVDGSLQSARQLIEEAEQLDAALVETTGVWSAWTDAAVIRALELREIASAHLADNNFKDARSSLDEALALDPDAPELVELRQALHRANAEALTISARTAADDGLFENAEAMIAEMERLDPNSDAVAEVREYVATRKWAEHRRFAVTWGWLLPIAGMLLAPLMRLLAEFIESEWGTLVGL
jgi:tetratricopeptide (TPR) repeat protein